MLHFFSNIFEFFGLYAVSLFMINLLWNAYQTSKHTQLPLPQLAWMLYAIKYSTGILLGGILGAHHLVWFICAIGILGCITKRFHEIVLTIVIATLIQIYIPAKITAHISLYGIMWIVGATAFMYQKIILIRKQSFQGLSFLSMTGFGMMHCCAIAFFCEKDDMITATAHGVYSIAHAILLYFMIKYKNKKGIGGVSYILTPHHFLVLMQSSMEYIRSHEYFTNDQEYTKVVNSLLQTVNRIDPTTVEHSYEEMKIRFPNSLVLVDNNKVIGHAALYPTNIKPLDKVIIKGYGKLPVGEIGSVAICPDQQHHKLGTEITKRLLEELGGNFKVIISATINPHFITLAKKLGLEDGFPFPKEYYEEGKKHLSPHLPGKETEFVAKATFLLKTSDVYKPLLLNLLQT